MAQAFREHVAKARHFQNSTNTTALSDRLQKTTQRLAAACYACTNVRGKEEGVSKCMVGMVIAGAVIT